MIHIWQINCPRFQDFITMHIGSCDEDSLLGLLLAECSHRGRLSSDIRAAASGTQRACSGTTLTCDWEIHQGWIKTSTGLFGVLSSRTKAILPLFEVPGIWKRISDPAETKQKAYGEGVDCRRRRPRTSAGTQPNPEIVCVVAARVDARRITLPYSLFLGGSGYLWRGSKRRRYTHGMKGLPEFRRRDLHGPLHCCWIRIPFWSCACGAAMLKWLERYESPG